MALTIIALLVLGFIAGILAGLLGIGGGLLFTPVLFYLFSTGGVENPVLWSIGTSLFCTFISASSSTLRQYIQKNFFALDGIKVGILGVAGTALGKWLSTSGYYSQQEFAIFFSLVMLFAAYSFIRRTSSSFQKNSGSEQQKHITLPRAGLVGGIGGFVASLAGIGGGGVMVPFMNLLMGIPLRKAISISSLAIVFISLGGWLQLAFSSGAEMGISDFHLGFVDFGAALPLVIGGFLGGFLGVFLNHRVPRRILQYLFALLAVTVAINLIRSVIF